uniref:Serpin B6 n=1 Tax=Neogobius melanostomus TaxID=47308 RepID=A0A8C6SUQ7_9GOBI
MSPFFTILIRSITALYFFNAFAADTAASGNLCKANTTFTLDLFKSLGGKDKTSNVFFSPLSISSALSMLLLGAKGSTAKQMRELEKQLTCETFMEWTRPDKMDLHQVELKLPRFRVEENYELSEVLKHMGMEDAFAQTRCDFSAMCPTKDLMLSKAVHKAFVDVNEAGTEAGAATFVLMALGSSKGPQASFIADHPFLFFIRHNATRAVLFAGRFCSEK